MNILRTLRQQDAVYWPPAGVGTNGRTTYGAPVDVKCRWIDKAELFMMRDGSQGVSNSIVDMDRLPEIDGVLAKGTVAALPDRVKPAANGGEWAPLKSSAAWKVRGVSRVPEIGCTDDTDPDKTLLRAIL